VLEAERHQQRADALIVLARHDGSSDDDMAACLAQDLRVAIDHFRRRNGREVDRGERCGLVRGERLSGIVENEDRSDTGFAFLDEIGVGRFDRIALLPAQPARHLRAEQLDNRSAVDARPFAQLGLLSGEERTGLGDEADGYDDARNGKQLARDAPERAPVIDGPRHHQCP
jgi:hypothetical protein